MTALNSAKRKSTSTTKLTTLRVKFLGPFGFCLHGRGNQRHFAVHAPQLKDHDYWVGTPREKKPILDPLPDGTGKLTDVDLVSKVKLPDKTLALTLNANDKDVKITSVLATRNSFSFPLPAAILLNSIYFVNDLFRSKTPAGAAKRVNQRQKFVADEVTFVYSLSKHQTPKFSILNVDPVKSYEWTPSDPNADTADLHFAIGSAARIATPEDPDGDFGELVGLFPSLDLASKGMPIEWRVLNPPYHCRAASLFIINPPK